MSNHPWYKLPMWKKRLHGWACYQFSSWISLIYPVGVDKAMYKVLKDQFGG